jgi:hypothetical protein
MKNNGRLLGEIFGRVPIIETDLDPSIPMCKVCGMNPSTVTCIRWHNNLRVESDECPFCAVNDLPFKKEKSCDAAINVLTSMERKSQS